MLREKISLTSLVLYTHSQIKCANPLLNHGTREKHADRIDDRVRTHYLSNNLIDEEQITPRLKYREFTEAKLKRANNLSIDRQHIS